MKTGRNMVKRGIAWILAAVFLFLSIMESGVGMIEVQAAENLETGSLVAEVSADGQCYAVIKKDGSLWMWGHNSYGQLGDGTREFKSQPIKIMEDVASVVVRDRVTAAIKKDGSLWMWGDNSGSRLGDGTFEDKIVPIKVMEDVASVFLSGNTTGAIKKDGSLWMWGSDIDGQKGDGNQTGLAVPVKIMEDVAKVFLSDITTGAIKKDGSLWMWGNNYSGQLGDGTKEEKNSPIKVMEEVNDIFLLDYTTGAIKKDGSLWMWGENLHGKLGDGTKNDRTSPVKIMEDVVNISISERTTAAIKKDGSLWMWGYNSDGQLGDGTKREKTSPVKVMEDVADIVLQFCTTAAVKKDGSLWMWGKNHYGQLGDGTKNDTLIPIKVMEDVVSVIRPEYATAVIKKDGSLWGWGAYLQKSETSYEVYTIPFQIYPDISTDAEDTSKPDKTFSVQVETITEPQIKVVDEKGNPLSDVSVKHQGATYITKEDGTVTLGNYKAGTSLELSKEEYETKIISSYVRDKSGCSNFILSAKGTILHDIVMELNGKETNLLETDVTINLHYRTTQFSIRCEGKASAASYELYSGNKKIAQSEDGYFENLSYSSFDKEKEVFVKAVSGLGKVLEEKKLLVTVINMDPSMFKISLGGGATIEIPKKIPLVGGMKLDLELLDSFPITIEVSGDGNVQVGLNVNDLAETDSEWFKTVKKLNAKNFDSFMSSMKKVKKKRVKKGKLQPKVEMIGYLEGNSISSDNFKGKLLIQFSASQYWEAQTFIAGFPIVMEFSLSGKLNADGSISYVIEDGFSGNVGFGGEVGIGGYAGAGIAKWASAGVYGTLGMGIRYDLLPEIIRGVNEFYFDGDLGAKLKIYGRDVGKISIFNKRYDIIRNEAGKGRSLLNEANTLQFSNLSIDNYEVYEDLERSYLAVNGGEEMQWAACSQSYANGNMRETTVQEAAYLDSVPQVVKTENGAMLFYLTDGGAERSSADRSQLVYSLYRKEDGSWSEPVAVNDDGTADFSPDIYAADGKVYVVWQNAKGSLEGDLTLDEIAGSMELQAAIYDETTGNITVLKTIEREQSLQPQRPQIAANEGEVHIYWYENQEDNVFGFFGNNKLYQAIIMEGNEESEMIEPEVTETEKAQWMVTLLGEEKQYISSADAGCVNGEMAYAYTSGKLDESYEVSEGKVVSYNADGGFVILEEGKPEHIEISAVFLDDTLSWYQDGNIHYINEQGNTETFFEEGRLTSSLYTLIADGDGSPEIIFPLNVDGKSNLYRIAYENGEFLNALAITDQEDYIQYVDGFHHGNEIIFVYNQMEVDENLEEVNNSLCTGTLSHSYYDINLVDAGSIIRMDSETREDYLEISAQIYNNGTIKAEGLNLQLSEADGTVLETVSVNDVLEPGETKYVNAEFSLDNITEESQYTISIVGNNENNTDNDSFSMKLGEALLQMTTEVINIGEARTLQVGIENKGVTACGGSIRVCDAETGAEYCNSAFEPVTQEESIYAEVPVEKNIFKGREHLILEVQVIPENDGEILSEQVIVCAPTYTVTFVTDAEEERVYSSYGETVSFPQNPIKEGFRFKGWYTAQNAEEGILYKEETKVTDSVNLYACFAEENETIPMEECSVSTIADQMYTGKALKPAVTVKWGSTVLKPKKDYTISYTDNKEQGIATVTITGKGNYSGSISREFAVYYPVSKVNVKSIPTVKFDGNYHTPGLEVSYQNKSLTEGVDYTVAYTNHRNAGTAAVTITGKGNYSGSKTVNFKIEGISIGDMKFEKTENVVYSGDSEKIPIIVKNDDGKQLRQGADYKVVYENTINKGKVSVTVIGNGNYTGTKKMTYRIGAKNLTADMIEEMPSLSYTGGSLRPEISVMDGERILVSGKDYKISYSGNKNAGTAYATISGTGNYTGKIKVPFVIDKVNLEENSSVRIVVNDMAYSGRSCKPSVQVYLGDKKLSGKDYSVSYVDNIEQGQATVVITGNGNYTGSINGNFRIVEKKQLISALKVEKPGSYIYTGDAIEPEVKVMDGTYELKLNTDYEVRYEKQYNVGVASVTITGKGNYAGSKTLTYKITKRSLGQKNIWAEGVEITAPGEQKYTGNALKPDVMLKDNGKLLKLGKDYTLSYSSNINLGTAKITVKGKGNYQGSVGNVTFTVAKWNYDSLQAQVADQTYSGKALKPQVVFTLDGEEIDLKTGKAVKIIYSNNKNAGTAKVTIIGLGVMKDMTPLNITFEIERAELKDAVVSRIANQRLKGVAIKPIPKVKVGKTSLKAGRDFEVSYIRNRVKGEAEVVITGIGNYCGKCSKSFIIQ